MSANFSARCNLNEILSYTLALINLLAFKIRMPPWRFPAVAALLLLQLQLTLTFRCEFVLLYFPAPLLADNKNHFSYQLQLHQAVSRVLRAWCVRGASAEVAENEYLLNFIIILFAERINSFNNT